MRGRPDEYADLMRLNTVFAHRAEPDSDGFALLSFRSKSSNLRWWSVEHRNRMAALFAIAISVDNLRPEEPIGLFSDLVRCAVVHAKRFRPTPNIHSLRLPGERLLEDALAEIP